MIDPVLTPDPTCESPSVPAGHFYSAHDDAVFSAHDDEFTSPYVILGPMLALLSMNVSHY